HVHIIPNRGSRPAVLLRESYREGGKVKKRTLANLSSLPMHQVEAIQRLLKGERLLPIQELFDVTGSAHHG
ncbi:IS1634 family transposase, partial [Nitrospiraceae bacterium AH_259_D15_M11_P09]|nr:IS1634 family transposase [Nitrospiraceae bacterium AH_259_D15_M11_P09]